MSLRPALVLGVLLGSLALTASLVNYNAPAHANPCAGKVNPCAGKVNPCAGKSNPCAGKSNPCAGKATVGGSLARQLQGKPVVVDIYASWCPACKKIAPTLSELRTNYKRKAHFIVLDVSDKNKATQSAITARKLGLGKFFAENKSKTGLVAIVDPATGKILAQYVQNSNTVDYAKVLDTAIAKQ
jgi:thiol-disulfide isomerase/thioredoxin